MNIIRTITRFLAAALVMTAAFGCDKNRHNTEEPESADRRVLLFYECAFNDIGSYMRRNMEDQQKGLPAGIFLESTATCFWYIQESPRTATPP